MALLGAVVQSVPVQRKPHGHMTTKGPKLGFAMSIGAITALIGGAAKAGVGISKAVKKKKNNKG